MFSIIIMDEYNICQLAVHVHSIVSRKQLQTKILNFPVSLSAFQVVDEFLLFLFLLKGRLVGIGATPEIVANLLTALPFHKWVRR